MVRTMCATGVDPEGAVKGIPPKDEFARFDYLKAPAVRKVAEALIQSRPEFAHLLRYHIGYFWKAKTAMKGGKPVAGKVSKASGLTAFLGELDFIIEVAADEARLVTNLE